MDREIIVRASATTIFSGIAIYFHAIAVPVIMLIAVMALDYITGITAAWVTKKLNSRKGLFGIIKKVGYLALVAVAMAVDWVLQTLVYNAGIEIEVVHVVGVLVVIWIIINELISILENISRLGVPIPKFLTKFIVRLKEATERKVENALPNFDEEIKVGSIVRVKSGSKNCKGQFVRQFVYGNDYRVDDINGSKILLDKNGLNTWFYLEDLSKMQ